ncbi:hypothetical protein Hanom_Chr13g01202121 [Helianthus anomalus]
MGLGRPLVKMEHRTDFSFRVQLNSRQFYLIKPISLGLNRNHLTIFLLKRKTIY